MNKMPIELGSSMSILTLIDMVKVMEEVLDSVTSVKLEHELPACPAGAVFAYLCFEDEDEVQEYISTVNEVLTDRYDFCITMPIVVDDVSIDLEEGHLKLDKESCFILFIYASPHLKL